jgi:hypothetical protein
VAKADAKSERQPLVVAIRWRRQASQRAAVPKIDQKATQAWLDEYEPKLREAIKGSKFELERRETCWR